MYFNNTNNFFHGIMFHHFHDKKIHKKGQGSISKDDFYKIIKFIGRKNIIDADIFFEKLKDNKLKKNDICFTFDDAIKCQIDVALPVLEDLKIKSFFFVYTSMFEGKPDNLEIFRYFRMNYFNNVEEFYNIFYKVLNKNLKNFFKKNNNKINKIKKKYLFYSIEDIKFRLVRDLYLTKKEYEKNMFILMKEKKFDQKKIKSHLFFDKKDLNLLDSMGHTIGLHSHNHPTEINSLSFKDQKKEYSTCLKILSKILKKKSDSIKTASHPLGKYNNDSLKILKELGIELAFKDSMHIDKEKKMKKINNSFLEIARQDHIEVVKKMKQ